MDPTQAAILLENLLQRLEPAADRTQTVVSRLERQALSTLLELVLPRTPVSPTLPPSAVPQPASEGEGGDQAVERVAATELETAPWSLSTVAHHRKAPDEPHVTLCLDFGTAKSKACAAKASAVDPEESELIELALGDADGDVDRSVFAATSSIWVSDEGRVFVGSEAFTRGQMLTGMGVRDRIDSLKHYVSLAGSPVELTQKPLTVEENPSGVALTVDDAVTLYLGYLTDLATTALEKEGHSRYVRRRFTLPVWPAAHRAWSTAFLSERFAAAQLVADTFHDAWREGIPAVDVREVLEYARQNADGLRYLVDVDETAEGHLSSKWGGVLEPLAAGSGRVWTDRSIRQTVLIVDVGAGTTDFSLFLVMRRAGEQERAFLIDHAHDAVRFAGDYLDECLVRQLIARGHVGNEQMRRTVESRIRQDGVRRWKHLLFASGALDYKLGNDVPVSLTLDEFLGVEDVRQFGRAIEERIQESLRSVHSSFGPLLDMDRVTLVLTGGGCNLPMIREIANRQWTVNGRVIRFKLAPLVPEAVGQTYTDAFLKEYPQLAVAIGGASPNQLDERQALLKWEGGEPPPGELSSFPTKGV